MIRHASFLGGIYHQWILRDGGTAMPGRGNIAFGLLLTMLGLAGLTADALGAGVSLLSGQSLLVGGILAVVLGYIFTVGGFYAMVRWERSEKSKLKIYMSGVEDTIHEEHPGYRPL
jgi:hypothetical protein